MPFEIDRGLYARMYGPTVGDRVRLGDTNLLAEVERDFTAYGDETLWGFGKTIRSARTCWRLAGPSRWTGESFGSRRLDGEAPIVSG